MSSDLRLGRVLLRREMQAQQPVLHPMPILRKEMLAWKAQAELVEEQKCSIAWELHLSEGRVERLEGRVQMAFGEGSGFGGGAAKSDPFGGNGMGWRR